MSGRQIKKALETKNYPVESVEYIRNAPTPTGYGKGYDINFIDVDDSFVEIEDYVFDFNPSLDISSHMEFDDFQQAVKWVDSLPSIKLRVVSDE